MGQPCVLLSSIHQASKHQHQHQHRQQSARNKTTTRRGAAPTSTSIPPFSSPSQQTQARHTQVIYKMNKVILSRCFLVLLVSCMCMASSVSCGGSRKLAQQNQFPLRFDRATSDFTGEFFDEYIDEADWLPETYGYDELITEGWGAFSSILGTFLQSSYDSINPGK